MEEYHPIDYTIKNLLFNITIPVSLGATYRINMYDSYGDGITYPGFYALFFGTNTSDRRNLLVFNNSYYKTRYDTHDFVAATRATPSPTVSPPTISPRPTFAPSGCHAPPTNEVPVDPFQTQPIIKNTDYVFGANNKFCTSHTNYADCTNEQREDCQWIFLPPSAGTPKGKCRIDPITKCLQLGNCVCYTEDFQGGPAYGIVFHAPISVTPRDISVSANASTYVEFYSPTPNNKSAHPDDDASFFISKVDFTSRNITYTFLPNSPLYITKISNNNGISSAYTIAFKLHYLYTDVPLVGTIFSGLGMTVSIDTTNPTKHTITINSQPYVLAVPLKNWTCTSIVITPTALRVARNSIVRGGEVVPQPVSPQLVLGSFSGILWDVRIYPGSLSWQQTRQVGARCTDPSDPEALIPTRAINLLYQRDGCQPRFTDWFHEPADGKITYGSGPFSTLWVRPVEDVFNPGVYYDVPEGQLDTEYYFQHYKFEAYIFEKYYFEQDMIGFQLEPYRYFTGPNEFAPSASSVWNNPCRYIHQNNDLWSFPLYSVPALPKYTGSDPFDLRTAFYAGGYNGYQYVSHEIFHQFQQTLYLTYGSGGTHWLDESSASHGAASTFPFTNVLYSALPQAIAYPMGYAGDTQPTANAHFLTPDLSISAANRVGTIYNDWVLWWFLGKYAGLPHLLGQMYSNERYTAGVNNGMLSMVRLYVEGENLDFGDVWGIFVAHYRTWDFEAGRPMGSC